MSLDILNLRYNFCNVKLQKRNKLFSLNLYLKRSNRYVNMFYNKKFVLINSLYYTLYFLKML